MRKTVWILLLFAIVSCDKEIEYPLEFNYLRGEWQAYKLREISDFGTPYSSHVDYSTDSLGIEYYVFISDGKIEIFNSQSSSSVFHIREVQVKMKTTSNITFYITSYSYFDTEKTGSNITYYYSDEILLSSGDGVENTDNLFVYYLKRKEN